MLRGAALRVTRPRVAVLSAVRGHPHADTDSIIGVVREDLGEVSHQAVYDVLRALTAAGLVRRFQPKGSVARYEARVGDNHHHVVCRSCGAIADVDCAVGYTPCMTAADGSGYEIEEAEVIYWGRCPECVAATSAASGGWSQTRSAQYQQSYPALDPEQPTSSATSQQQEAARQEKDRRV
jgi:Fur family ferric uptake transcriptional regulator